MSLVLGLQSTCVLLDRPAASVSDVVAAAALALAEHCRADPSVVAGALSDAVSESDFALGAGIAVPHAAVPGLERRAVALVRAVAPVDVGAIDGVPVDLFFVVVYPPGKQSEHLQFLAHVAGICRSRVFRDGLREATSTSDVLELVAAAEARLGGIALAPPPAGKRALAMIAVSGDRAADAIVVGLIRDELAAASIVDAQTLQEAASREVPLFAGFRDLFGDPGGRRMIFAQIDVDRADALATVVRAACEEEPTASAEIVVVPVAHYWSWGAPPRSRRVTGH